MSNSIEPPVRFDRQKLIAAPPWDLEIFTAMRPGFELPTLNSLNYKQAKNCVHSKSLFSKEEWSFKKVY